MTTFSSLGLPEPIIAALDRAGITEPFPIQEAAIPDALAGKDVCGKAPTGSGKTVAFGMPVIANVGDGRRGHPRALILAPTRELAEQIKDELIPAAREMGRWILAVYGGVGYGPQKGALRKGVDLLVATPGRLEDLIEQGAVSLSEVDIVVIDEADRMADMGFLPAVRRILDQTSKDRQTLLFSATLDGDIAVLSRDYQTDPVRHEAAGMDEGASDAKHHFWLVDHHDRVLHTAELIEASGSTIVFTRTRHGADRLAKQLDRRGLESVAIHGGRSQNQRQRALKQFQQGKVAALIATDVAARGIHVDSVAAVVQFDPPADHKDYLHRAGRTARAGETGVVVTLVTPEKRREVHHLREDLGLTATIDEPDADALATGGMKLGEVPEGTPKAHPAREQERSARRVERREPSIYVANLPWATTPEDLLDLFSRYGRVHEATIITDRRTGRPRGFGFVDMPADDAKRAIDALNGSEIGGREVTVRFAEKRSGAKGRRR
jgi:superfamily II DNA/RNA helicase